MRPLDNWDRLWRDAGSCCPRPRAALGCGVTGARLWGGGCSWVTDRESLLCLHIGDFSSWRRLLSASANPGFEHLHVFWTLEAKELWQKTDYSPRKDEWKRNVGFNLARNQWCKEGKAAGNHILTNGGQLTRHGSWNLWPLLAGEILPFFPHMWIYRINSVLGS